MKEHWISYIAEMIEVKESIYKKDKNVVSFSLPQASATDKEIKNVEKKLGIKLENTYKDFLKNANGWKQVISNIDILGTNELLSDKYQEHTKELLTLVDDEKLHYSHHNKEDLIPIAVTKDKNDAFFMTKKHNHSKDKIIWISHSKHNLDKFASFEELFLFLIEYHKEEVHI